MPLTSANVPVSVAPRAAPGDGTEAGRQARTRAGSGVHQEHREIKNGNRVDQRHKYPKNRGYSKTSATPCFRPMRKTMNSAGAATATPTSQTRMPVGDRFRRIHRGIAPHVKRLRWRVAAQTARVEHRHQDAQHALGDLNPEKWRVWLENQRVEHRFAPPLDCRHGPADVDELHPRIGRERAGAPQLHTVAGERPDDVDGRHAQAVGIGCGRVELCVGVVVNRTW